MYPQALALDSSHKNVGVILKELDARHRHTRFQPIDGVCKGFNIARETFDGGVHCGKAVDVPDIEAVVAPDPIQSDGQLAIRVESNGLTGARHLQAELQIGIGVVVDTEQVDHAGRSTHGYQAGYRRRPIVSGERREVIMLGEFLEVEIPTAGMSSRFVKLNNAMLKVDVEE